MESIKNVDIGIWDSLLKIHPKHWSVHGFDNTYKSEHTTNNIFESFNAWLGKARKLPIIHISEFIRKRLMKRFNNKRKKAAAWKFSVTQMIYNKMQKQIIPGKKCAIMPVSESLFEVDNKGKTYIVNLDNKSCDCGGLSVSDIPCKHVLQCIMHNGADICDYINNCFKKETYLRAY